MSPARMTTLPLFWHYLPLLYLTVPCTRTTTLAGWGGDICFFYYESFSSFFSITKQVMLFKASYCFQRWQWNVGVVAIFLCWINLVLFIQKFPRFGIYVVMFKDIMKTFFQFFLVFVLFIVAFALAFYTLLKNQVSSLET